MGGYADRCELSVGAALGAADLADRQQVGDSGTFKEPGTYILRCRADDGALFTNEDVTVTVTALIALKRGPADCHGRDGRVRARVSVSRKSARPRSPTWA